jgi:hypothetical protein
MSDHCIVHGTENTANTDVKSRLCHENSVGKVFLPVRIFPRNFVDYGVVVVLQHPDVYG